MPESDPAALDERVLSRPIFKGASSGRVGLTLGAAFLVAACGSAPEDRAPAFPNDQPAAEIAAAEERLEVPPPPFSPGIYPCSMCHEMMPVNRERRELTAFHTDIVLHHDEDNRWCLDCHDALNRDQLHLASGEPVTFEESYRLCGQCHGEKYRDWRSGVHGKRTGQWNGHKTYLLCAHCHNPHSPRFQPVEPLPAPIPPHETVWGSGPADSSEGAEGGNPPAESPAGAGGGAHP